MQSLRNTDGAGAGKIKFNEFTIKKPVDFAPGGGGTPKFMPRISSPGGGIGGAAAVRAR